MSKIYEIAWVKNYHATGTELIEAESEDEALKIARDNIGNYEGSMQYAGVWCAVSSVSVCAIISRQLLPPSERVSRSKVGSTR